MMGKKRPRRRRRRRDNNNHTRLHTFRTTCGLLVPSYMTCTHHHQIISHEIPAQQQR